MASVRRALVVLVTSILIVLAALLGASGALVTFVLAAPSLHHTVGRTLISLLVCFALAWGLGWLAARVVGARLRQRFALGLAASVCLAVAVLAASTIFRPFPGRARSESPDAAVRFWDLSTGSRIAYRVFAGTAPALEPPIVFLHGGPGGGVVSSRAFTEVLGSLATDGFDVYVYDQVGGGLSARLEDVREYTAARHVADLEAIREVIGAQTLWVIAESWGAELALRYAAEHADRLEGLVLVSPGELYPDQWGETDPCDPKARVSEEARQRIGGLLGPRLLMADVLLDLSPEAGHDFFPDPEADAFMSSLLALLIEAALCDPQRLPPNPEIQMAFWAYTMTDLDTQSGVHGLESRLAGIDLPVLILRGECDYCLPEVAEEYLELLPGASLLPVEDSGHFLFVEQPDRFREIVRPFLLQGSLPNPSSWAPPR